MPKFNTTASASRATGTRTPSARGRGSKWSLGQKVKLSIVSGREAVWYDAEIIDVKLSKGDAVPVTRYVVHYIGWDPVYDVTLTESEAEKRMKPAGGGGVAQKVGLFYSPRPSQTNEIDLLCREPTPSQ
jgi:hypothetical protein